MNRAAIAEARNPFGAVNVCAVERASAVEMSATASVFANVARLVRTAGAVSGRRETTMANEPKGDVGHCRPDYFPWEQHTTCVKCAAPLADNPLVKDAYKLNTVNSWAKRQLRILADMAGRKGMQWFADEARKIADGLRCLLSANDEKEGE